MKNNILVVGLTGNIACGKTTSADFFKKLGAKVLEADKIAHGFMKIGTPYYEEILKYFGDPILDPKGNIKRRILGQIVFSDREKLKVLNKILHPPTINNIKEIIETETKNKIIIIESAIILETKLKNMIDKLVVVKSYRHIQLSRLKNKNLTVEEGKQRLAAQKTITEKIKQADYVIHNNRDLDYLNLQIKKIWDKLLKEIEQDKK